MSHELKQFSTIFHYNEDKHAAINLASYRDTGSLYLYFRNHNCLYPSSVDVQYLQKLLASSRLLV